MPPVRVAYDIFARAAQKMVLPYDMLPSGLAFDMVRLPSSAVGPDDCWRTEEDSTASFGNTLSGQACGNSGVEE